MSPSILDGGMHPASTRFPASLAEVLTFAASQRVEGGISYRKGDDTVVRQSYADLLAEAQGVATGLRSAGIQAGERVILQVSEPSSLLPTFWGCLLGGIVPLLTAPIDGTAQAAVRRLFDTWNRLSRPRIVTTGEHKNALRAMLEEQGYTVKPLLVLEDLDRRGSEALMAAGQGDDVAFLMLSSGSTAAPKLVQLSHRSFLTSLIGSAVVNEYQPHDVSLNWLPLYHIGGLMRSMRDVYVGCRQHQVATPLIQRDPLRWLDLIDEERATMSWGPNTAFRMVADRAHEFGGRRAWDLRGLHSLYSSGEPVIDRTMQEFWNALAPYGLSQNALHTAWGMTEACSSTYSRTYFVDGFREGRRLPNVGRPTPGVAVRIVDGDGQVVEEGTSGNIEIRGPLVCPGYELDAELNRSAFTGDGWLRTGDLGEVRDGCLTVVGRAKDIIILGGVNYSNLEIEAAVAQSPGVDPSCVAACAVRPSDAEGEALAVFFHTAVTEASAQDRLVHAIRDEVVRALGVAPRFVVPLPAHAMPRSAVGKIQRAELRTRFDAGVFDEWRRWPFDLRGVPASTDPGGGTASNAELARRIAQVVADTLGLKEVGLNENIFALGGTSLKVAQAVERLASLVPGRRCTVVDLFRSPSPQALAAHLTRRETSGGAVVQGTDQGTRRQTVRNGREARSLRRAAGRGQELLKEGD